MGLDGDRERERKKKEEKFEGGTEGMGTLRMTGAREDDRR